MLQAVSVQNCVIPVDRYGEGAHTQRLFKNSEVIRNVTVEESLNQADYFDTYRWLKNS